jgi:hypothetical protein
LEGDITENEMSATNSSKESSDKPKEICEKKRKRAVSSNMHDMESKGGKRETAVEENITENTMSATNSSKESSDKSKESCNKKMKFAVSSNMHDMESKGGKREAAGDGMVAEWNPQANANATMQKEESSATKIKPRLDNSDIIDLTVEPEDAGKIEVNSRILVWWPHEKRYYSGTVDRIKVKRPDPHHILYDDGDKHWINLHHRDFKRIDAAAGSTTSKPSKQKRSNNSSSTSSNSALQHRNSEICHDEIEESPSSSRGSQLFQSEMTGRRSKRKQQPKRKKFSMHDHDEDSDYESGKLLNKSMKIFNNASGLNDDFSLAASMKEVHSKNLSGASSHTTQLAPTSSRGTAKKPNGKVSLMSHPIDLDSDESSSLQENASTIRPRATIRSIDEYSDHAIGVVSSKHKCCICKNAAKKPRATSCHHIFCLTCIMVSKKVAFCPFCNEYVGDRLRKNAPGNDSFKAVTARKYWTTSEDPVQYNSASAASLALKLIPSPSCIIEACKSRRQYQGYYWLFVD